MARVLVVDDSMYQRIKIRKFLEAAGYEVIEGKDGEEGLAMAESSSPDCLLLDLLMPNVDGMQVLHGLREKKISLPVIIHTSDIQEQTRDECLAYGAVAFLNKPSKEQEVLAALEKTLGTHGKEA